MLLDSLITASVNSVTQSCVTLCNPMDLQHARLSCPSPIPGTCSNSCPLSWWCHPNISSSVIFSFCLQSYPASGSLPMSRLFASCGQSVVSFSITISPSNEYSGLISFRIDWFDLLAVQRTLRTTLHKLQFYDTQPSLWSNSHICTWLLEKP